MTNPQNDDEFIADLSGKGISGEELLQRLRKIRQDLKKGISQEFHTPLLAPPWVWDTLKQAEDERRYEDAMKIRMQILKANYLL